MLMTSFKEFRGYCVAFKAGSSTPVHPEAEVPIAELRLAGRISNDQTCKVKYYIYADNMEPVEGEFPMLVKGW